MSTAVGAEPYLRHALPGRVRVHLPGWSGVGPDRIEAALRPIPGVQSVQANPLTCTVLICFDNAVTDAQILLAATRTLPLGQISKRADRAADPIPRPHRRGQKCPAHRSVRDVAGRRAVGNTFSLSSSGRPWLLGPNAAALIWSGVGIVVSLILADSPVALLATGLDLLQLVTDVMGRFAVGSRNEVRLGSAVSLSWSFQVTASSRAYGATGTVCLG